MKKKKHKKAEEYYSRFSLLLNADSIHNPRQGNKAQRIELD